MKHLTVIEVENISMEELVNNFFIIKSFKGIGVENMELLNVFWIN